MDQNWQTRLCYAKIPISNLSSKSTAEIQLQVKNRRHYMLGIRFYEIYFNICGMMLVETLPYLVLKIPRLNNWNKLPQIQCFYSDLGNTYPRKRVDKNLQKVEIIKMVIPCLRYFSLDFEKLHYKNNKHFNSSCIRVICIIIS